MIMITIIAIMVQSQICVYIYIYMYICINKNTSLPGCRPRLRPGPATARREPRGKADAAPLLYYALYCTIPYYTILYCTIL